MTSAEIPDYYTNRHAPILTFDLGNDLLLSGVQFQNYWNANALKDFALAFATEAEGPNAFGSSIDYFPIFHPLYNNALVQSFSFDQWVGARYVQLLALDNYQGWGYAGGDRVGFAELTFLVVPEPGTLSLLALGGLGLWRRRRR